MGCPMQAQHNIHATDAQKAHIARLLLQANLAYGESNSPASLVQRIKARHECRGYLEMDRQSAAAFCGVAHAKRLQGQFDVAYLHYRKLLDNGVRPQDISMQQMYRRLPPLCLDIRASLRSHQAAVYRIEHCQPQQSACNQ